MNPEFTPKRSLALQYLSVLSLPVLACISFHSHGWLAYLPVMEAFVLVPLLEWFFSPDPSNLSEAEEQARLNDRWFDVMVYLIVPVQWMFVILFLRSVSTPHLDAMTIAGRISSMGMLCGVMGINVAHELGHRKHPYEQWMAKALLMTSLYMHFFIEHNRGHHRYVATREDPSSARLGEALYPFWIRSVFFSYRSAWKLEKDRLAKKGRSPWSLSNEMLRFQVIQLLFVAGIGGYFGFQIAVYYVLAATIGILLLETVNYIEHYGLVRSRQGTAYERVKPWHSWNSDHKVGRIMLFELSRHSDHHYMAYRKYQILRHLEQSPQMPTGYPGMMILATIPPLWFRVMDRRILRFQMTGSFDF